MHDVVRDVAISIASRDHHWLVLGKEDVFEEWPNEDTMRKFSLVRLKDAKVSKLLDELDCPSLSLFSMHGTAEVPDNCFNGMQRLKVLEFTEMQFTSLPSSIGSLKTLCTLRMMHCDLKDIAILGELENLEILDLRGSRITVLPKEIGQLNRLKLLDLSECISLKVISPNVLSKLSRLEELYLSRSFDKWEVEEIENPRNNASLVELQHLSRLTTLEVRIPDVDAIPKDNLFFGKMERYKIFIGDEERVWYYDKRVETSIMLKLGMNKSIHLVDGIKLLLGKTQSLHLDGLEDVGEMLYNPSAESLGQLRFININDCNMSKKNLFSFFIAKRLRQLEELTIYKCDNIKGLIIENGEIGENDILEFNKLRILKFILLNRFNGLWYSENTLQPCTWLFDKKVSCPALEELYLNSMRRIKEIWHIDDQLPLISFGVQNLTILRVHGCHKLKYVFTSSMVKSFAQLKTLSVSSCNEMEGTIEGILASTEEGISSSIRVFPKLECLELQIIPKLNRFCCGITPIEFPSLRKLEIRECPDLNKFVFYNGDDRVPLPHYFFNEKVILPVLEKLSIKSMDNLERLWPNQLAQHSFSELTSINLGHCPKLLHVFPLSMLTKLQRLNKLDIWHCESLEEIIFGSQSQGGSNSAMQSLSPQLVQSDANTFLFPFLIYLCLRTLPNLRSIHHKMHTISCPSLKELEVSRCDQVEILFASEETSGNISHQALFWVTESTFPNLHRLTLEENAGIKETILQSEEGGEKKQVSPRLPRIIELRPNDLPELMHVWKEKEGFQNLRMLQVCRCPELVNLVPSSVSFRNLVDLVVWDCDGIIKLITHSTAKSLVQLQRMSIRRCQNIEEIIQGGDDDDDNEIHFPLLNSLELEDLPVLESFCSSGNYTFGFPYLNILKLYDCPKMKMFSQGDSNTPMLHKVLVQRWVYQGRWEGSLNSTIQQLFREKHARIQEGNNSEEGES